MEQTKTASAPPTALERLERLEKEIERITGQLATLSSYQDTLINLIQVQDLMAGDIQSLKGLGKSVSQQLVAILQLSDRGGPVNSSSVKGLVESNLVQELKEKVDNLVADGLLVPSPGPVSSSSFVVGVEVFTDTGAVANPRIQLLVSTLEEPYRSAMMGKLVGDMAAISKSDRYRLQITEIYTLSDPPAEGPAPADAQ